MRATSILLQDLIVIAERILATAYESVDQVEPLADLALEIQFAYARPAVDARTVTDAEIILIRTLGQLAGGTESDIARMRYRDIAGHALQMTRAHAFAAFQQERGNG